MLSCDESRAFWVRWDAGLVEVGTGTSPGQQRFMFLDDRASHLDINAVAFDTGDVAEWFLLGAIGEAVCVRV